MARTVGNSSNGRGASAVLELDGIRKSYPLGSGTVEVLHGISVRIEAGKLVAIVGPSGSGKSTLLNLLGTLDAPERGHGCASTAARSAASAKASGPGSAPPTSASSSSSSTSCPALSARQNVELAAAIAGMASGARRASGAGDAARARSGSPASATRRRATSAAARCSGWRSPARWSTSRGCSWPTSRPATSTSATRAQILELLREQADRRARGGDGHPRPRPGRRASPTRSISLVDGEVDAVTTRRAQRQAPAACARRSAR